MHTAESEIMFQLVSVTKDSLEIPSRAATDPQQLHQDQRSSIPADQVLVESMLSAKQEMELLLVFVFQDLMEILIKNVNLSAQ